MINKRYTDEEIIKALECCLCDNSECLQCDNKELCKIEHDELAVKTLGLINRKMEEINRLKAEIERIQKARLKQAQFLAEQKAQKYELMKKLSQAKAEACKEFADKLKEIVRQNDYPLADKLNSIDRGMFTIGFEQAIDEVLKEMVGEKDDR